MKKQLSKKLFACRPGRQAFIITMVMFSALPTFTNAQRNCPTGQLLLCNENGKHCKCVYMPRPCRACFPYSEGIVPVNGAFAAAGSQSIAINFQSEDAGSVAIKIFDAQGRLIKTLANEKMSQGDHQIEWDKKGEDGNAVNPGIYFLQINSGNKSETRKLSVVNYIMTKPAK